MTLHTQAFDSEQELLRFANGAAARAVLLMVPPQHLTDEQSMTLNDGTNPAVEFRIDRGGDGVGGGATAVDISAVAADDKNALATALASAINGVGAGLAITATAVGDKVVLVNDATGIAGNTQILQSQSAYLFEGATQFEGGEAGITTTNIIQIDHQDGVWRIFWRT